MIKIIDVRCRLFSSNQVQSIQSIWVITRDYAFCNYDSFTRQIAGNISRDFLSRGVRKSMSVMDNSDEIKKYFTERFCWKCRKISAFKKKRGFQGDV